jgi:glucosylceramidase
MILDENGGPWLADEKHHNADKNQQHAVVVINRHSGEVTYTGLYYYLAHFSKFVRPGAVKLAVTGGQAGVRCAVFDGPGQKRVAELLNSTAASVPAQVLSEQSALFLELPPFSISTAVWRRR